ncbi:hypothetical protein [uncultured Campylobacter sp.]|uniref:hypothetical protein n=1 Tax=uncultured Campylobacter sp. TaxID=218934 RepID=UPI0028EEBB2A|nr:hypothetical protein [uncultured Campylobacter sp.]
MQTEAKQNGENKALGLVLLGICAFYFICALGIFVLPFDVLARSSLARVFVEAMLKIYPAVERAFTHTDFTQKAALYIAYMGIIKVVTLVGFVAACLLCGSKENKAYTLKMIIKENPVKRFFLSIFIIFVSSFFVYWDFSGYHIGYRHPRYSPEYEWVLKSPGELFWQMCIDFMLVVFVAACIFYVSLQIRLLFRKRKNA